MCIHIMIVSCNSDGLIVYTIRCNEMYSCALCFSVPSSLIHEKIFSALEEKQP